MDSNVNNVEEARIALRNAAQSGHETGGKQALVGIGYALLAIAERMPDMQGRTIDLLIREEMERAYPLTVVNGG